MHPVNYLFEDIYRNDIGSGASRSRRQEGAGPRVRNLRFLVERKRN